MAIQSLFPTGSWGEDYHWNSAELELLRILPVVLDKVPVEGTTSDYTVAVADKWYMEPMIIIIIIEQTGFICWKS